MPINFNTFWCLHAYLWLLNVLYNHYNFYHRTTHYSYTTTEFIQLLIIEKLLLPLAFKLNLNRIYQYIIHTNAILQYYCLFNETLVNNWVLTDPLDSFRQRRRCRTGNLTKMTFSPHWNNIPFIFTVLFPPNRKLYIYPSAARANL